MKIISGGQTGVDVGALRAAKACGLETGGFAPAGFKTEDGPAPWLADFGLVEAPTGDYPTRTRMNVEAADFVLLVASDFDSPGSKAMTRAANALGRKVTKLTAFKAMPPDFAVFLADMIFALGPTMMVAGNRESSAPGIGEWAERFLAEVFREMARIEKEDRSE